MSQINFSKVTALPTTLTANTIYLKKGPSDTKVELHFTNSAGTASYEVAGASSTGVTDNEISALNGIDTTSTIQDQLNAKVNTLDLPTLNIGTATKLATARKIATTGDATFEVTFDGSADVSAAITLANSGVTAQTTQALYPFKVNAKGVITEVGTAVTVPDVSGKLDTTGASDAIAISTIDGLTATTLQTAIAEIVGKLVTASQTGVIEW